MKFLIIILIAIASFASVIAAQPCADTAKIVVPSLSIETRASYTTKLEEAKRNLEKAPNDADAMIWVGRRTAYLGLYRDAIRVFTEGISKHPNDPRFYRHRGHRYITIRCFDNAIADFEKAAQLIKGKPDEIEPDGLPNLANMPTSTLQSNIWYHLGLAYYLKGDFKRATAAYKEAMKVSKNNDMLAATTHWYYMTLRRIQEYKPAEKLLEPIDGDFEVIENEDYLKLLRLYRGEVKADALLGAMGDQADTLGNASLGYGIGNWYLYNGDREMATSIFRRITTGNQWASFGYIAAEAELKRMN